MRVALVSEYYPPFAPGGAEISTQLLAQELATQPEIDRVVVITPNYGALPYEETGKLVTERFPFPFKLGRMRLHPYALLANPAFYLWMAWHIVRLIRKHDLQVVHVQNKQSVVGAVWAARRAKVPVVVTLRDVQLLCRFGMCLNHYNEQPHGCDRASYRQCLREYRARYMPGMGRMRRVVFGVMARYHRFDAWLKGWALRRADALVTISDKLGEIMQSRQVTPPRVLTIYNPMPAAQPDLDFAQLHAARTDDRIDEEARIVFAGRLTWGKGADLLVEALPAVDAALAPRRVRLLIAGEGPLQAYMTARATELGVADALRFLGRVPAAAMARHFAEADVAVVPSVVQEGFGRVALEALVAGTPVVASTHGGLPEIVEDGVTGLVVEPTSACLGQAIVKVVRDAPAYRQRVAEALPKLAVKFGDDVSRRHVALYASLLGQGLTDGAR